jgi:hypothetical protein
VVQNRPKHDPNCRKCYGSGQVIVRNEKGLEFTSACGCKVVTQ